MRPKTQYARNDGVNIAYQVLGDGPIDLLTAPGFISHLDLWWGDPQAAAFLRSLASFSRLIIYDKRGTGLSDPVIGVPTLEQRIDDVRAVLDAAGSERAAIFGWSEGGPMSLLFAATYPERTSALVLWGSFAKGTGDERQEGALPQSGLDTVVDAVANHWGDGRTLDLFSPSAASQSARARERQGIFERAAASPGLANAVIQAVLEIDVTDVLPTVRVPTLVLHRSGDVVPVSGGRYIAEHVPGARFVELAGNDHTPWLGNSHELVAEIERFVTGTRHVRSDVRSLATVLFTDIVGSTETASAVGDARWKDLLAQHDEIVRRNLEDYDGREVKHTGDGFLATFDGPARAIRCACSVRDDVEEQGGLQVRAGLHTGELEVLGEDVGGIAVHIGARIAAAAGAGEVLVSGTVRDLVVGSEIEFDDRGVHSLKGAPGEWQLLAVRDSAPHSRVGEPTEPAPIGREERVLLATARRAPWAVRLAARRENRKREKASARDAS